MPPGQVHETDGGHLHERGAVDRAAARRVADDREWFGPAASRPSRAGSARDPSCRSDRCRPCLRESRDASGRCRKSAAASRPVRSPPRGFAVCGAAAGLTATANAKSRAADTVSLMGRLLMLYTDAWRRRLAVRPHALWSCCLAGFAAHPAAQTVRGRARPLARSGRPPRRKRPPA